MLGKGGSNNGWSNWLIHRNVRNYLYNNICVTHDSRLLSERGPTGPLIRYGVGVTGGVDVLAVTANIETASYLFLKWCLKHLVTRRADIRSETRCSWTFRIKIVSNFVLWIQFMKCNCLT